MCVIYGHRPLKQASHRAYLLPFMVGATHGIEAEKVLECLYIFFTHILSSFGGTSNVTENAQNAIKVCRNI